MERRCQLLPPSLVFANPMPVPVHPAMYPTFRFSRWMAVKERATPSPEIGVASAIADGGTATFEADGVGLAPACGEQAVSRTAPINSIRACTTDITKAALIRYSNALGFLRAECIVGHPGTSLGPRAIAAQRRRPRHCVQPRPGS